MVELRKTQKMILLAFVASFLLNSLPMQAGILDSFGQWWKGNFQKNATLTVLSTCIAGFGIGWISSKIYSLFSTPVPAKKSLNPHISPTATSLAPAASRKIHAPEIPTTSIIVLHSIDQIEGKLNQLIQRIDQEMADWQKTNGYNIKTIKGWVSALQLIGAELFNLEIRCTDKLHMILIDRYYKIIEEQPHLKLNAQNLYSVFGKTRTQGQSSTYEQIKCAIDTLAIAKGMLEENLRNEWQYIIKNILNKVFANKYAKENYDAFLSGPIFTEKLQILDKRVQERLKTLLEKTVQKGKELQKHISNISSSQSHSFTTSRNDTAVLMVDLD